MLPVFYTRKLLRNITVFVFFFKKICCRKKDDNKRAHSQGTSTFQLASITDFKFYRQMDRQGRWAKHLTLDFSGGEHSYTLCCFGQKHQLIIETQERLVPNQCLAKEQKVQRIHNVFKIPPHAEVSHIPKGHIQCVNKFN